MNEWSGANVKEVQVTKYKQRQARLLKKKSKVVCKYTENMFCKVVATQQVWLV